MSQTFLQEVGGRIAQLRNNRDLSQAALAKEINEFCDRKNRIYEHTNRSNIAMWELGKRDFKSIDLLMFADFFGVTVDYLLRGIEAQNVDIYRATGLSQDAINNLRSFKEKDLIEGTDEPAGKCAALSRALSSWSVVNIVASLLMLKGSKPGHYDAMMPSLPMDKDPSTAGDFYEGMLSPDTYAAALSHRLYLTLESIRKGEGGELPVYEPFEREKERTIEEPRKSGRLIEKKGDQDGTPTEQG